MTDANTPSKEAMELVDDFYSRAPAFRTKTKLADIIQSALDTAHNAAIEGALDVVIAERESDFPDLRTARDNIRALKMVNP